MIKIINVKDNPRYTIAAIDWFSSKWGIDRAEYEKSFDDMFNKNKPLPRWYIAVDKYKKIVGGCGLIQNDFCDRTDLFPYLCALFVEPEARGNALGALLLAHAKAEAYKNGFRKLYLCTDHTSYYEKYGWRHIGTVNHPWGGTSRLYEAETSEESI